MNSKANGTEPTDGVNSDLQLVERAQQGDSRAFEELVRRHERRVYRTTLAITKNEQDAEEALQDTFIKAFTHLDSFRRESRFTTWLTRIAINESLLILRSKKAASQWTDQEERSLAMPTRLGDWYANPEVRFARNQLQQIVEAAIQSLPEPYRIAFVLRDVEGQSTNDAAEAIGIAVPALKSRLLRARLMMREVLSERLARPVTLKSQAMDLVLAVRAAISAKLTRPSRRKGG